MERLLELMRQLRDPDTGCPWDRAQDFASIAPYTIEEAYEVAHAIASGDRLAMKDELGDLLFQVVFHAQMAAEEGAFAFDDVVEAIVTKMVRRHPHVFEPSDGPITEAAVSDNWEAIKAQERAAATQGAEPASVLDTVTPGLPALQRAQKIQRRAARVGFDWPDLPPVLEKLQEEVDELNAEVNRGTNGTRDGARDTNGVRIREELGDVLFSCVNLARHCDIDADRALREATARFERRFRLVEGAASDQQVNLADLSLDELEALWRNAKRAAAKDTSTEG